MPKPKMPKDAAVFSTKSRPKGFVKFYPYERLDGPSLREAQKFQVHPLGKIQEYCRHIPYNSGKKDFYVKTGRESFEGNLCTIPRFPWGERTNVKLTTQS